MDWVTLDHAALFIAPGTAQCGIPPFFKCSAGMPELNNLGPLPRLGRINRKIIIRQEYAAALRIIIDEPQVIAKGPNLCADRISRMLGLQAQYTAISPSNQLVIEALHIVRQRADTIVCKNDELALDRPLRKQPVAPGPKMKI